MCVLSFEDCIVMQPDSNNGVDGEKEKDEARAKSVKVSRMLLF